MLADDDVAVSLSIATSLGVLIMRRHFRAQFVTSIIGLHYFWKRILIQQLLLYLSVASSSFLLHFISLDYCDIYCMVIVSFWNAHKTKRSMLLTSSSTSLLLSLPSASRISMSLPVNNLLYRSLFVVLCGFPKP